MAWCVIAGFGVKQAYPPTNSRDMWMCGSNVSQCCFSKINVRAFQICQPRDTCWTSMPYCNVRAGGKIMKLTHNSSSRSDVLATGTRSETAAWQQCRTPVVQLGLLLRFITIRGIAIGSTLPRRLHQNPRGRLRRHNATTEPAQTAITRPRIHRHRVAKVSTELIGRLAASVTAIVPMRCALFCEVVGVVGIVVRGPSQHLRPRYPDVLESDEVHRS
jgi:hypothetical protein